MNKLEQCPWMLFNSFYFLILIICDALRDFVPFEQFKRHEKHEGVVLSVTFLHGCFSCFLDSINDTKSHEASHILAHIFAGFHRLSN